MQTTLSLAANGRVVIPAPMRAQLGWEGGAKILARLSHGTIILEPIDAAIRRAQSLVADYIPAGAALADELIAERHAAAKNE